MASRLFQELREKRGLCYSIYSFYWPFADTGVFGMQAATGGGCRRADAGRRRRARRATDDHRRGAEARAKAQLRAGLLMTLESPLARAGQIARQLLVYGRLLPLEEMVARVEAVDATHVRELAARIFDSAPTLAAIGPVNGMIGPRQDRRPHRRAASTGSSPWHSCARPTPFAARSSGPSGCCSCACRASPTIPPGRSSARKAAPS